MCRICGRVIRCIFDSMPSKISTSTPRKILPTVSSQGSRYQSRHISSSSLIRNAFNFDAKSISQSPPTFLLPSRAKLHQAATQYADNVLADSSDSTNELPLSMIQTPTESSSITNSQIDHRSDLAKPTTAQSRPLVLSKSLQQLLPSLEAQKPHYISAHIYRSPYLLTEGDILRLPFHLHDVKPGDVLRFNRASVIGSRDYTLKAGTHSRETEVSKRIQEPNYLDERLFECRLRVTAIDSQPMTIKEKTKRRNRRVRTVRSKHKYTVLKVMEVQVKTLDQLRAENSVLLLES